MEEEEAFSIKNFESDGWYKMIICDMKKVMRSITVLYNLEKSTLWSFISEVYFRRDIQNPNIQKHRL